MMMDTVAQWVAFSVFALVSVGGALGMTTTMSMFRSGIFLMASFFGVAGLFLLLSADLIGMLQIMMYTGGMLVMILFMLLFSHDPGGEMMSSMMKLPPLERFFSLGLAHDEKSEHGGGEHGGGEHGGGEHGGDMSMFTSEKRPAVAIAVVVCAALMILFAFWPGGLVPSTTAPPTDSASRVGHLLMGKYMIAFEGAGLLILLGIFGSVFLARPSAHPDAIDRDELYAAVDEPPVPLEGDDDVISRRSDNA